MSLRQVSLALFAGFVGLPLSVAAQTACSAASPCVFQDQKATPEARARDLVAHMTLEEKVLQMQSTAPAIERLGVPAYNWWNEALHGVAQGRATVFPQAIGLAASWDT